MKGRIKKFLAWSCMPLAFTLAGYFVIYVSAKPFIDMAMAVKSMVVSQSEQDFTSGLSSIFQEAAEEIEEETPEETIAGEEIATEEGAAPEETAQEEAPAEDQPQEDTVPMSAVVLPDYGACYGKLTCDRIGLDVPVYWGDDNTILKAGAGQYIGSFLPGFNRTILLAAHNTTYFAPLEYIAAGDRITFATNYGRYVYQVTEVSVRHHEDASAYDLSREREQLVLYTCYPFEILSVRKQQRLFVYADRISGPDVK